ncbi:PspC domain-containing protein [Flaviflexus huanghaiensis]|uniref:PspC domain-containing protein n=1 Tax=Flaviflexus huanghaiensis TaxID=1111473 RepID=UPI0015FC2DC1|nr:PspC domain-containing protein [Flaviflexus huanghaiensis]
MTGDTFFDSIRSLGIQRSDDAPLAGVSAGLAKRWNVDPLVVRAVFVALAFLGGSGVTLYALGWIFLPDSRERIHAQEPFYGKVSASLVFGILIAISSMSSFSFGFRDFYVFGPVGILLTIILIIVVVIMANSRDSRQPPHTPPGPAGVADADGESAAAPQADPYTAPDPPTAGPASSGPVTGAHRTWDSPPPNRPWAEGPSQQSDRSALYATVGEDIDKPDERPVLSSRVVLIALALLLIFAAGIALAFDRGFGSLSGSTIVIAAFGAAAVILGITVLISGITGRRGGGLSALAIVVAALSLPSAALISVPSAEHHVIMGEAFWSPTSAQEAEGGYSMLMGAIKVDVTDLDEAEFDISGRLGDVTLVASDEQKIAIVADYVIADVTGANGRNSNSGGITGDSIIFVGDITSVDEADIVINVDLIAGSFTLERQS